MTANKARGSQSRRAARMPPYRPLRVYAFDPTRGQTLGNHMTIKLPYEDLAPGPIGNYVEVIGYDATNNRYYLPVNLNATTRR
jgi:cell wall assembly regulator SMI1